MAIVSSFIGFLIIVYSLGYIHHEENQNEYYLMVVLFIGSMMGLVFSGNLIFIYLFWEIIAICCWRLIGFYRLKDHVRKADKAFLVTFFGAVVMLLGFVQVFGVTHSFDLTTMRGTVIPGTAVLLILFGMFSKSATVPLHTWLPDAGVAPTTVTALLHAAVLVKIGVYAYARIFLYTFRLPGEWPQVIPVVAVVSSLIAAAAAAVENDLKRILAYSTVSQIGYIFLGFSVANAEGISGSLLFILMHGLAKAGLFLCAGIVIHAVHTKDIREMGGLIKTMPLTAVSFLFCAFSVIGIPPFGGFFSKFLVIMGTVKAGQVWVAAVALFTAVLTMYYLLKVFVMVFLGEARNPAPEKTRSMVFVVTLLAFLSLVAGFLVSYPAKLAEVATAHIGWWLK
jgi:NADH:ubiquinone oxidoreductase subunit 5 (subunit L)/multisubunit Na+/H+ antiporter MnhA subunit